MKARGRRMSVSLTLEAVRARTKTVTRRAAHTWGDLKPGDRLVLIEKGMGLRKGEKQVVVDVVVIVSNELEPLSNVTEHEVYLEGFGGQKTAEEFVRFWLLSHDGNPDLEGALETEVRRIEWRYLTAEELEAYELEAVGGQTSLELEESTS